MKTNIDKHFSRAATSYDEAAVAQRAIASELASLCAEVATSAIDGKDMRALKILEIGSGTGIFTALIAELFPNAEIDALDLCAAMIERAREKFEKTSTCKIDFIEKDFLEFETKKRYDLVLSSSTLQWLDLRSAFKKVGELLAREGKFLASIVCEGTFSELHELRREFAPKKLPRKNLPTRGEILAALASAPEISFQKQFTIYYKNAGEFLRSIKELGVTGGEFSTSETPLTRREILEISKAYEERHSSQKDSVYASYEVLFIAL